MQAALSLLHSHEYWKVQNYATGWTRALRRSRATHLQGPWVGVQVSRRSRVQLQILVRPYGNGLDRDVRFDAHRGCQNHQRALRKHIKNYVFCPLANQSLFTVAKGMDKSDSR